MTTMRDIARVVGLSVATVSRALEGSPKVSAETRGRIVRVAQELGYVPPAAAKAMRDPGARTIALITSSPAFPYGPYLSSALYSVQYLLRRRDMQLLMSWDHSSPDGMLEAHHRLASDRSVAGILTFSPTLEPDLVTGLSGLHLPHVMLGAYPGPGDSWGSLVCAGPDNLAAGGVIAEALYDLGHRDFVYVGLANYRGSRLRMEGIRRFLASKGIELAGDKVLWIEKTVHDLVFQAIDEYLQSHDLPTALIGANDMIARTAISALRLHGKSVPGDVSVAGFSNYYENCHFDPPLTTVDTHPSEVGTESARLLLQQLDGEKIAERHVCVLPELKMRESCGPPRSGKQTGTKRGREGAGPSQIEQLRSILSDFRADHSRISREMVSRVGNLVGEDGSIILREARERETLADAFEGYGLWKKTEGPLLLVRIPGGSGEDGVESVLVCRKPKNVEEIPERSEVVFREKATQRFYLRPLVRERDGTGAVREFLSLEADGKKTIVRRWGPGDVEVEGVVVLRIGPGLIDRKPA